MIAEIDLTLVASPPVTVKKYKKSTASEIDVNRSAVY